MKTTNKKSGKDFVLSPLKPADCSDEPKCAKLPEYDEFKGLEKAILKGISDYYMSHHVNGEIPADDAEDEFIDDYDKWVEVKRSHDLINKFLTARGSNEKEEPLANRLIDALFSYYDGERYYDGSCYFKGLREVEVTPEWRRIYLARLTGFHGGN